MALIAPSILSADFANLQAGVETIAESGADWVHVDVMDGLFVPNITIGIPVVAALRRVTSLPLDVHLMIDRPIRYVEQFCKAGADYLTIHVEADTPENTLAALEKIAALGVKRERLLAPVALFVFGADAEFKFEIFTGGIGRARGMEDVFLGTVGALAGGGFGQEGLDAAAVFQTVERDGDLRAVQAGGVDDAGRAVGIYAPGADARTEF